MSGRNSECNNFGDTVELKPGMVPDTYSFKCPGDMCIDDNKNKPVVEEKVAPQIRKMPKTDTTKCPAPPPKEEKQDECADEEKPKPIEEAPPPITTKLPDTINFKCSEQIIANEEGKGPGKDAEVKTDTNNNTCGTSLLAGMVKRNCSCGRPVAPFPKVEKPCGNKWGGLNCGPNTSCEVTPLTMTNNKK